MFWDKYLRIEAKVSHLFKRWGILFLRYSMGIIYFWYGSLKILGISPAE